MDHELYSSIPGKINVGLCLWLQQEELIRQLQEQHFQQYMQQVYQQQLQHQQHQYHQLQEMAANHPARPPVTHTEVTHTATPLLQNGDSAPTTENGPVSEPESVPISNDENNTGNVS